MAAVELYRSPFLEGFFLREAPEFGHWVDRERARLAGAYTRALEGLADEAETRGSRLESVEWWRKRAAQDPFDSRVAVRLMKALSAAGNRAGAIRHADLHETLLREELGVELDSEVRALAARLRQAEVPGDGTNQQVTSAANGVVEDDVLHTSFEAPAGGAKTPGMVTDGPPDTGIPPSPTRRWLAAFAVLAIAAVLAGVGLSTAGREGNPGSDPSAEDIARAVVRELSEGPGAATDPRRAPPTGSLIAWELYEKASRPEVIRSDSAAAEALALLREAVEVDPTFAAAHAGLARLYLRVGPPDDPNMARGDRYSLARSHAARALELDPFLPAGHATLGVADMLLYRFEEAEVHLERAAELDPVGSPAQEWLVPLLVWRGRFAEALEKAELALSVDPLSPTARGELAHALLVNGRCTEALAEIEALVDLQPPPLRAGLIASQCHAQRGQWNEALADIESGLPRSGARGKAAWGHVLARAGRPDEALRVLEELLESDRRGGQLAFEVATVFAGLGRTDDAFEWLERAVADHSLTFEVREPRFGDLHTDPRFSALLGKVGLPGL